MEIETSSSPPRSVLNVLVARVGRQTGGQFHAFFLEIIAQYCLEVIFPLHILFSLRFLDYRFDQFSCVIIMDVPQANVPLDVIVVGYVIVRVAAEPRC